MRESCGFKLPAELQALQGLTVGIEDPKEIFRQTFVLFLPGTDTNYWKRIWNQIPQENNTFGETYPRGELLSSLYRLLLRS